jgi:hypothetical protein
MSEVQSSQDADTQPVGTTPARCEAPAWVGKGSGVPIWSERVGLIGWCSNGNALKELADSSKQQKPDLFHAELLQLTPLAVHELCTGGDYASLFAGAVVTLPYPQGPVDVTYEHVIWGTFPFHKTKEPVLRNLIMANQQVAPSEISECLKRVRNASGGSK